MANNRAFSEYIKKTLLTFLKIQKKNILQTKYNFDIFRKYRKKIYYKINEINKCLIKQIELLTQSEYLSIEKYQYRDSKSLYNKLLKIKIDINR